jgi:hypothetical protein
LWQKNYNLDFSKIASKREDDHKNAMPLKTIVGILAVLSTKNYTI